MIKFIQFTFSSISVLSPRLAAFLAFKLFQRPRKSVSQIKPHESLFYERSSTFFVSWLREDIRCYEQGNPEHPMAVLVHGWESNAGSLGQIADHLSSSGYYVVSIDLPAHGRSELSSTNLIECREAFRAVLSRLMPEPDTILITHSFGSAVAAHALSDSTISIKKWVMLTSPNSVKDIFNDFRQLIGLGNMAHEKLIKRAEVILREPVEEVRVDIKLQGVKCQEILILHDTNDKVLPIENSRRISFQNSKVRLVELQKTGHYSMLYNPDVIQHLLEFIHPEKEDFRLGKDLKKQFLKHSIM